MEEKFQGYFLVNSTIFLLLLLVWIFVTEGTSTLASASFTSVPSFSLSLSQERYDAECCHDVADNICQGADTTMEVIQNLLEDSPLHCCLLPYFGNLVN